LTRAPVWAADISLSSNTTLSTEGYFVISWASEAGVDTPVVLQQSPSENFGTTLSREFNLPAYGSVTITGLTDGAYYFRVTHAGQSSFSDLLVVEVAHHSLSRALTFFSVGLVLFLILLGTIIRGNQSLTENGKKPARESNNAS